MNNIKDILSYIDPIGLDYQEWVNVGMALHHEGEPVELWDMWSQRDPKRYHPGDCGCVTPGTVSGRMVTVETVDM